MADKKAAKKDLRQNEKRRVRNKAERTRMRTQIKKFFKALDAGDAKTAEAEYQRAASFLDKAAKHNLIHNNEASRRKARLARRLNDLKSK